MSETGFQPFPKMGRLTRNCVITEKIDGTNAQVNIVPYLEVTQDGTVDPNAIIAVREINGVGHAILAGSRTRYIWPGKSSDNAGFAAWVAEHMDELVELGPGRHFGEWWGGKIQRGYGLIEKRFSLFNTSRWYDRHCPPGYRILAEGQQWAPACCHVVPVLFEGLFSDRTVDNMLELLKARGSVAAPGFMNPEGVVTYHIATGVLFKKTLDNDALPKSAQAALNMQTTEPYGV